MEPRKTPFEPGIAARIAAGLSVMVTGRAPEWFGPEEPLAPDVPPEQKPSVAGRMFDYPAGYNTHARPRSNEPIDFAQLRALADNYDVLRMVIERRKDQMERLDWVIKPKDAKQHRDKRCDDLAAFFLMPDGEHSWATWLRMLLEDMLVIDAPAIYKRRTLGGKMHALEPVDGATIKRVLDAQGRTPVAPDPAYQQILKGVPAINYTRDELIYRPRNVRTNRIYGYSPTEQVLMTVNIALRRQMHQLRYYTAGNVPDALAGVPKEWTPQQIKEFQDYWDFLITDSTRRRQLRFIPSGVDFHQTTEPPLKDSYDEWLARVVCFCFSIEPTPFVSQVNRATAETSRQQSLEEGLSPLKNWVNDIIDQVIALDFGYPDLEFSWVEDDPTSPLERANIAAVYINAKILTPDEVRADLGREPLTDEQKAAAWPAAPAQDPQGGKPPDNEAPDNEAPDTGKEAVSKAKKGLKPIDRDRAAIGGAAGGASVPMHPDCRCAVMPVLDDDKESVAKGYNPDQPRVPAGSPEGGEFASSMDSLGGLAADAKANSARNKIHRLGAVNRSNVEAVARWTGVDLSGYQRIAADDELRHVFNSHGDNKKEKLRGQRAVTAADLERVDVITRKPDFVGKSAETWKHQPVIEYHKSINGERYVYVEAQKEKDARVQFISLRIHTPKKK